MRLWPHAWDRQFSPVSCSIPGPFATHLLFQNNATTSDLYLSHFTLNSLYKEKSVWPWGV